MFPSLVTVAVSEGLLGEAALERRMSPAASSAEKLWDRLGTVGPSDVFPPAWLNIDCYKYTNVREVLTVFLYVHTLFPRPSRCKSRKKKTERINTPAFTR